MDSLSDERLYRERLIGELWRYGQVVGFQEKADYRKGCVWEDFGCVSAINDMTFLAGKLPFPDEPDLPEKINRLLAFCHSPQVREFPPEDIFALMKLAVGEPATVALYGRVPVQLFDPPKVVNLRQTKVRYKAFDIIDAYLARYWPRDITAQELADKLDRPLSFIQKNKNARDLRIVDFMNIMQALGRNPTFSLKELAAYLEEALANAPPGT